MDTAPAQGRVAGFIIISWILISWSMSVCEMPQCISNQNEPGTAQQVPHGKHKLSLITAVSVGYSREALCLFPFSVFCSRLSCRGRGAPLKWLHLARSSFHKPKATKKIICMTSYGGEDWCRDYIFSYRKCWKGHSDGFWSFSRCGSLQMIYNLRFVWLQVSLQARAFICSRRIEQYFSRNNIVLSDSLHLWALSSRCTVICSIIKWALFRGS